MHHKCITYAHICTHMPVQIYHDAGNMQRCSYAEHQVYRNMQVYAFYNIKHANIWYYMQEYAKNMKKYA